MGRGGRGAAAAAAMFQEQDELFDMDALLFDGLDGIPGFDAPLAAAEGTSPGRVNNTFSIDHRSESMGEFAHCQFFTVAHPADQSPVHCCS